MLKGAPAIAAAPPPDRPHLRWGWPERAAFLTEAPLFCHLPPDTARDIARRFRPCRVRRGAFLFHEGDPADALCVLATGRVKVIRETEDGQEVILRLNGPGEIVGWAGGWGAATYPASAMATEAGVVLQLPARAFTALLGAHPAFALALIHELEERLHEVESRVFQLQTQRAERRIAAALLRLARKTGVRTAAGIAIGMPLSRQDLAELTGTTSSTVSRTLSAWERQGLVAVGRERVIIRRLPALVTLAEDLPSDDPTSGR